MHLRLRKDLSLLVAHKECMLRHRTGLHAWDSQNHLSPCLSSHPLKTDNVHPDGEFQAKRPVAATAGAREAPPRGRPDRTRRWHGERERMVSTGGKVRLIAYSVLFVAFGCAVVLIGPTVAPLAAAVGVPAERLGFLFVYASAAELIGALVAGETYDRARNAHSVLAMSAIGLAVPFAIIPFCSAFGLVWVAAAWTVSALFRPFLNTGGNLLVAWLLGEKSAPWLNALNGMFGLGASLAPACASAGAYAVYSTGSSFSGLVAPYLSVGAIIFVIALGIWFMPPPARSSSDAAASEAMVAESEPSNKPDANDAPEQGSTTTGTDTLAVVEGGAEKAGAQVESNDEEGKEHQWGTFEFAVAVLFLAAATAFEVAIGNWIHTIAMNAGLSSRVASFVTSMYWGSFTSARLVLVPALFSLTNLSLSTCLLGASTLMCVSCASVFALPGQALPIWLCALAGGVGVAPCYGSTVALIREKLPFHGRTQSALAIACGVGGGLGPYLAARAMRALGYGGAIALCLCLAGCCLASAGSMALASAPQQKNKQQKQPSAATTTASLSAGKSERAHHVNSRAVQRQRVTLTQPQNNTNNSSSVHAPRYPSTINHSRRGFRSRRGSASQLCRAGDPIGRCSRRCTGTVMKSALC